MNKYLPEGQLINNPDNKNYLKTVFLLQEAMQQGRILESRAIICDSEHNLIVDLPCIKGIIPRNEGAIGIEEGTTRDIALISKVNKPVCFKVTNITTDSKNEPIAILSRKAVQLECMDEYISKLSPGCVISAKVTHLEQFGCFVDVACGIASLIPIDTISVSRISHPSDRFTPGQDIYAVIKSIDNGRIFLSHKELLGTWEDNADKFHSGETVSGIVRSVEDYGIFIELAPNLAGLAEPRENVSVGQHASVYIKAIIPEKMKIKLIIVDVFDAKYPANEPEYFIKTGQIDVWRYSSESSDKIIETRFI